MVPDRQKVWTDGRTEWTDGRKDGRQNYIPPTSSGDKNVESNPDAHYSMTDGSGSNVER